MLRSILAALAALVLVTVCLIPDDAYARGGRGGGGGFRGGGGGFHGGGMRAGGFRGGSIHAGRIHGGGRYAGRARPVHPIAGRPIRPGGPIAGRPAVQSPVIPAMAAATARAGAMAQPPLAPLRRMARMERTAIPGTTAAITTNMAAMYARNIPIRDTINNTDALCDGGFVPPSSVS